MLLSLFANTPKQEDWVMATADVSTAVLYGFIERPVFVELPSEDVASKDPNMVGQLVRALYGTRDAPNIWQKEVTKAFSDMGLLESPHHPGVYATRDGKVRAVAYFDDLLIVGKRKHVAEVLKSLEQKYSLTHTVLGHRGTDKKETAYLRRTVKIEEGGLTWTHNTEIVKGLVAEWGVDASGMGKVVTTPFADVNCDPAQQKK